jgi:SsrA-binding protein
MLIRNPKAKLEYKFEYELEVGIVLFSDEVKSLRSNAPSLSAAFCYVSKGEIFIRHLSLSKAKDPERDKKLLLHKRQINKIMGIFSQKSYVLIPLELYEKKGLFKILIAAGKHLKQHDRREIIKERDTKREMKIYFIE